MRELVHNLFDIGAIQFGSFTLKSGIESPFYIDLRRIISYPSLMMEIAEKIWEKVEGNSFDLVCGVPYTALPIATTISITHNIPMVMKRKEVKKYGTRRLIEGVYKQGQKCLVVEDLVTSGASLKETLMPLKLEGLVIEDVAIILDRCQGGVRLLEKEGYRVHALMTIHEAVHELASAQKITSEQAAQIEKFIKSNQVS